VALRNRWLAELVLFAALAILHTWPLATDPLHLSRLDNDDTAFNTWVVAWVAHALPTDPIHLFDAPIFYPERDALAFSEHMVVQAVMGAPLQWAGLSPVLVYNLLVMVGYALSGFAMCVVMRRWTGSTAAGVVAGSLFAFNAHLLTRFAHLQALHAEFLPFVLYAFDRLLREPRATTAGLLATTFVLQALCSNYTMVFLAAALIVAMFVRSEPWRRDAGRLWVFLTVSGVVVVAVLLPFLIPYYRISVNLGMVRRMDEVEMYSAGLFDYLTTAGRLHYEAWSHRYFTSTSLFPGVTAMLLAIGALIAGVGWRDARARMAVAFGVVGVLLSLGASLPGYAWLHEHVPILQGIRAVARWGYLALVAVAILAGFAVARLGDGARGRWWWPAVAIAIVGLVNIEALRAPMALTRHNGIAQVHALLDRDDVNAVVVFPLYGRGQFHGNARYLLDQTRHWKPMINGYSSFVPTSFHERAAKLQTFPDAASIAELRSIQVTHVVLHRAPLVQAFGNPAIDALRTHPDLEFLAEEEGVILYRIR
jgi:hypothetical protein